MYCPTIADIVTSFPVHSLSRGLTSENTVVTMTPAPMPTPAESRKIFSLLEVTRSIQKTLSDRYSSSFWVKAEMNKLNHYRQSGHCYPELVEKQDGKVVAQMKATLWHDDYVRVNADFQRVLSEPLKDGIKILMLASIEFHPH